MMVEKLAKGRSEGKWIENVPGFLILSNYIYNITVVDIDVVLAAHTFGLNCDVSK